MPTPPVAEAGPHRLEVTLGEFRINFSGRSRTHAKRKALDFWVHNRSRLGLSLVEFFSCCRMSSDERTITFIRQSRIS